MATADSAASESRPAPSAAPERAAAERVSADESTVGLVKLFFATLLPDLSVKGLVYGIAMIVLTAFGAIVIAGKLRRAPSSPFRCNDPALQARLGGNLLPSAPYLALTTVVSVATIFIVEFCGRSYSRKSEATYWTARHVQRYFVGIIIMGCFAHGLQLGINAKRPYFIDACQPAITLENGTEFFVCRGELARAAISRGFEEDAQEAEAAAMERAQSAFLPALMRWNDGIPLSSYYGYPGELAALDSTRDVYSPGSSQGDLLPVFDNVLDVGAPVDGDVTNYNCTGPKAKKSGASFPSGHASVASFASAFLFGYGFQRCCNCDKPLGVLVLALVTAAHAVLVCVQRYVQNFHHLVDLAAGCGIGTVMAAPFVMWPLGEAPTWLAGGSAQAAPT